jgi:hypothetical protein
VSEPVLPELPELPESLTVTYPTETSVLKISAYEQSESLEVARQLLKEVVYARNPQQHRISEAYPWKGFKLWWMYYEWIFVKYALVYSKYTTLFHALQTAKSIEIRVQQESLATLIEWYAYSLQIPTTRISQASRLGFLKQMLPALLKLVLSLLCLPALIWKAPRYGIFSSDFFSPQGKFDFRNKNIYQEWEARKSCFFECIRTLHPPRTMLSQFFKRARPVLYLEAVYTLLESLDQLVETRFPSWKRYGVLPFPALIALSVQRRSFWFVKAEILFLKQILTLISCRSMMIASLSPRTLRLMIACKLSDIKVVGIMHGVSMRSYVISEFMEEKSEDDYRMSNDIYGVWSEGWIDYFNRYSKVLNKNLLQVSGFLRYESPQSVDIHKHKDKRHPTKLNVLWVSEPLLDLKEALPYLEILVESEDISVIFKVRPNRDIIQEQLEAQRPDLLKKLRVLDCPIDEAFGIVDVVVGSNSTGVLDGLRYDKPIITFKTRKWGDYFDIVEYHQLEDIYAQDPQEFLRFVRQAPQRPQSVWRPLKHFFFDAQERNGGVWIVDQMQNFASQKRLPAHKRVRQTQEVLRKKGL